MIVGSCRGVLGFMFDGWLWVRFGGCFDWCLWLIGGCLFDSIGGVGGVGGSAGVLS